MARTEDSNAVLGWKLPVFIDKELASQDIGMSTQGHFQPQVRKQKRIAIQPLLGQKSYFNIENDIKFQST